MEINGTTLIQSGCHGSYIGRLDVELDGTRFAGIRHHLIHVDESIPPDPEMHRVVEQIVGPKRPMLSEVVGRTETGLNRSTFLETTMDNLLLQAIAHAANTRIAFSNGWCYGAPIPPDRTYTVAFITSQDVPSLFGTQRRELSITAIDALRA